MGDMPKVHKTAVVPYSAEQMYKLVNDVHSYQDFLPGCQSSEILEQNQSSMLAKMVLSKAGIEQILSTRNTLIPNKRIDMTLAEGPFKSLDGGWCFNAIGDDACQIELNLEFYFSSILIDMAFGQVFKSLTSNMIKAFTDRAKKVYG